MLEIKAGLLGWKRTQMRGLWRCPVRLSYALAAESGMCSGTGSVFSTGLWWISVHLDNRVVRSLGWHSTWAGQKLAHADHKVYSFTLFCHRGSVVGLWNADISNLRSARWRQSTAVQQTLALFSVCRGDLCAGRGKGPWSVGILGYGGGRWEGWGGKSALLVFDPGQRYTPGHRTTAAVHLVEAQPPPALS